jgi:hypothetical protein
VSLAALGERLVSVLPPAFLVLLVLNAGFLFAILHVVQQNADQRNVMLTRIIESCLVDRQKP